MEGKGRAISDGRLYGVGLGPGDPELVTVKARRVIEAADVIAYPVARHGRSVARGIASPYLRDDQVELALTFPVTTEATDHPGGYEGALREFYDASADELAAYLDRGLTVAVLCEGDPFLYGSYIYLHERLVARYAVEVIPGVTSFSAAAAAAGTPLARRDDVLTLVPGTLGADAVAQRLRASDAAVVLKLGRTFAAVREGVERAGLGERAVYVERASSPRQRVSPLRDVDGDVPYMSLVLVPARNGARRPERGGEVAVVGLGPGGGEWLTPEAQQALGEADELVGYGPYLARVTPRAGQPRHASDNRDESARARLALALAAEGRRVAVVSSGDPGIFAMATAVLEAAAESGDGVSVRVVPGLSAMQAVAARAGAPLGHDFCVLSLSDQLKPWDVVERRLHAAAGADLALALYNPASSARRKQLERARAVLLRHRASDTPVVVGRDVGGPEEEVVITTLAGFDAERVDMRTLLIVGSSTTRRFDAADGSRVYTPRRYPA